LRVFQENTTQTTTLPLKAAELPLSQRPEIVAMNSSRSLCQRHHFTTFSRSQLWYSAI